MLMTSEVAKTKMKGKDGFYRQNLNVHDGMFCAHWLGYLFDFVAHVLNIACRQNNFLSFLSTHSQC